MQPPRQKRPFTRTTGKDVRRMIENGNLIFGPIALLFLAAIIADRR